MDACAGGCVDLQLYCLSPQYTALVLESSLDARQAIPYLVANAQHIMLSMRDLACRICLTICQHLPKARLPLHPCLP